MANESIPGTVAPRTDGTANSVLPHPTRFSFVRRLTVKKKAVAALSLSSVVLGVPGTYLTTGIFIRVNCIFP